jgi:chromosome partitioning protein
VRKSQKTPAMQVWSVISQKGGAGKTTLCLFLASIAAARGRDSLLIDLDPQRSAGRWSDILQVEDSRPDIVAGLHDRLGDMLKQAREHGTELAIVDTPPKIDRAALLAADAADVILVPTRGGVLDLHALRDTVELLRLGKCAHKAVVVLNAMPAGEGEVDKIRTEVRGFGLPLLTATLADRDWFARKLRSGDLVHEVSPKRPVAATAELAKLYDQVCAREAKFARQGR